MAKSGKHRFTRRKEGIPVAGLLNVDAAEDYLEIRNPKVQRQIAEGYAEYRSGRATPARALMADLRGRK
jgi:hypothetical protein